MKKMLFLLICTGGYFKASSQVLIALLFGNKLNTDKLEFGLVVSPVYTNITNLQSQPKTGLGLSLYFNVKMTENFFLHPEASPKAVFGAKDILPYSTGNKTLDSLFKNEGAVKRHLKAMSVPLLARYRIKGLLFAELGPQIDWFINAKDVFETKVDGNELTYTVRIKEQVSKFDIGLAGGLEYKLKKDKGMGLGFRYYYGFTDIMKTNDGIQHNAAWMFNVSIPIGAGKTNGRKNNNSE